jgi:hypothetical protein
MITPAKFQPDPDDVEDDKLDIASAEREFGAMLSAAEEEIDSICQGEREFVCDERFWDCDCDDNYIHSILEDHCEVCGALLEDCPPSRLSEIPTTMIILANKIDDINPEVWDCGV